jgi:hypothetical protein
MADVLIRLRAGKTVPHAGYKETETLWSGTNGGAWVYGEPGTFCTVRDGEDSISAVGYISAAGGESIREVLTETLHSFNEDHVREVKERLAGQYVIVVKKTSLVFIFADVLGARNIFYSVEQGIISTSFLEIETILRTVPEDLDRYKVLEYIAMRHVLYPAWIGSGTCHKGVRWLLPYEFLVVDRGNGGLRLGSVVYRIDNRKEVDCSALSRRLLSILSSITVRDGDGGSPVGATLTGGHDSRLIAAVAAAKFKDVRFRIATSGKNKRSLIDCSVAQKVARVRGVPLDIFQFQFGRDEERFYALTEGFSPAYNHTVTPLIDGAGRYSLGLGGAFGTEMFMPITWDTIGGFIQQRTELAKRYLKVDEGFWAILTERMFEQFNEIKAHYDLVEKSDRDYIRLFELLLTARYGSFIIAAFNKSGYQLDPYGSYPVLELSLCVSPVLWGDHRRFGGNGLIQKGAMKLVDPRMGRVLTYMHLRPMLPLTIWTAPLYLFGAMAQGVNWLRTRRGNSLANCAESTVPGGTYLSDGWESQFLRRTALSYGTAVV